MTRLPKTFNPPEELESLRKLWPILFVMTVGDVFFLWYSYSYTAGNDLLAGVLTASTMLAIIGLPMLSACVLGGALDHEDNPTSRKLLITMSVMLGLASVALIVFVTALRLSTSGVLAATSGAETSTAVFGQAQQSQSQAQSETGEQLLVWMMTVLLSGTAIFSFTLKLVDSCMTVRTPLIETYRARTARLRLAQIDASLASLAARSVEVQRKDAEGLRAAAEVEAKAYADEIKIDLEKEVAIASEDPASWPIALERPVTRLEPRVIGVPASRESATTSQRKAV